MEEHQLLHQLKSPALRKYDVTILTDSRYVNPKKDDPYVRNILLEDEMVRSALEKRGLRVYRTCWDDPGMDWGDTAFVLFRSTWDYFDRFSQFDRWLGRTKEQTAMINSYDLIRWNLDKHYLQDLSAGGIRIPPTIFIPRGAHRSLKEIIRESGWSDLILKPAISGAARHTYRIGGSADPEGYEELFRRLIRGEAMMIQEFQRQVPVKGEVAFMLFDGKFSHAVLKKAKKGDFRVQDDFGGTVHPYVPSEEEIIFAERAASACGKLPVYARVDAIWDNSNRMAISELELIEPELWFRFRPDAACLLAEAVIKTCF